MEEIDTDRIKPGFFKLRAKAHAQEQAGIPENLRAVKPKRTYSTKDPDLREALVLKYIKEHAGEWMPYETLAAAAGYSSQGNVYHVMSKLLRERRVRRKHLGNRHYTYVALPNTLPKGDPRNGEVIVKTPGLPRVIESAIELGEAIAKEPSAQAKTPGKPSEEVFVENLDRFIWEFLKQLDVSNAQYQNTTLGEATQALRAFSNYMSNRAKDTEHESKTDNQGS